MSITQQTAPSVISLGCRLNSCEADEMRQFASASGLAAAVIVNTCAVTGEAVRQAQQQIRRLRRESPGHRMIVTGCAAQIEPERFAAMPEVDHVIGNAEKTRRETFEQLAGRTNSAAPRVMVGDIMAATQSGVANDELEGVPVPSIPRAFVQIQNGCDHRCTFCVIPYGRGRSRSVPAEQVVARVRRLVESGLPEVVLTGVDITAWGADLAGTPSLGGLVRQVLKDIPRLSRLRLSSIDQSETDEELMAAIAEEPRLMPHLHLSLQSGNDLILKRMKRRHSRADAIAFCDRVRRLRPDIAIGADIIAGFPTESEVHFRDTLSIVDDCGLAFLHVFPYSVRHGTPAARMPQLEGAVVRERAARLRAKGEQVLSDWLGHFQGTSVEVAIERSGAGEMPARTPQFAQVRLSSPTGHAAGDMVRARVTGHDGRRLLAETPA